MVDVPFRMFSLLESCFHLTEGVELIVVIDFNALLFFGKDDWLMSVNMVRLLDDDQSIVVVV